ncbi:MAG TPA: hypothetical protein VMM15_41835 [Bradyrhizobium sp.]|nr:hypothetical protein [Bradyrhizobium sp.]
MRADKSRRAALFCALLAVSTIARGAPAAVAASAGVAPPLHNGPWPIRNGRNHQPTENELRALHLQDVTPDQAHDIDRLYGQLLAESEDVRDRHHTLKH